MERVTPSAGDTLMKVASAWRVKITGSPGVVESTEFVFGKIWPGISREVNEFS